MSIQSTTVVTPLTFVALENARADVAFTIAPATDCWTLHVWLTDEQYAKIRNDRIELTLRVFRTDDTSYRVNQAGEFLTASPIRIGTSLSQGYAACRFPNKADEQPHVAGGWTARLLGSGSFGGIDVSQIQVRLVERRLEVPSPLPPAAHDSYALPLRFVLVTPIADRQKANTLFNRAIDYFGSSIYNGTLRQIAFAPPDVKVTETAYGSDLRSGDLAALVSEYASDQGLTIFSIVRLSVAGQQNAVGFSMLPGPQCFVCPHSAVISRMRLDSQYDQHELIAARMAHEVAHYLGLKHQSACLGNIRTRDDITVCETALDHPGTPDANAIANNLLYRSRPGRYINPAQKYQLERSPIVQRTLNIPTTPVRKLRIRVRTGRGFQDLWDGLRSDDAGTDDNVRFDLKNASGRTLMSSDVSSSWDDFERGQNWWYQLDSGIDVNEEDIASFAIVKSFNRYRLSITGSDHWLLQGLEIEINDRQWYVNDDIGAWLASDGSGPSDFTGPLRRAALMAAAVDPPPSPPPVASFVTPAFSAYPLALDLAPGASARATSQDPWSAIAGAPSLLTLQAWIKPTRVSAEHVIVSAGDAQNRVFLRIRGGNYEAGAVAGGQQHFASSPIPADDLNRWIHLCGAFDGTAWMIHRNGEVLGTAAAPPLPPISGSVTVGAYDTTSGFYEGRLRNIAIWRTNRSALQELGDLFRIDPNDPDILAYWPLDDGEGTSAYDASPGSHHLTMTGATWFVPPLIAANTLFLPASPAASPSFVTASGAKLSNAFTTPNITVCGWFRIGRATAGTWERVLMANAGLVLRVRNGVYEFGLADSAADLLGAAVPAGDFGHWVHLTGQYDATARSWRLFRNSYLSGQLQASVGFSVPAAGTPWTFGGRAGAGSAPSALEMRALCVFHGVVSTERLRTAYMAPGGSLPAGSDADGLVAYWPLDDGGGNTAYDVTAGADLSAGAHGTFDPTVAAWTVSGPYPAMLFVAAGGGRRRPALASTIRAITDASATKRYTIFLEPGTFAERIVLPPFVSLVGAGASETEISAPAAYGPATLELTGSQTVRQMTVSSFGPEPVGTSFTAVAMNRGTGVELDDVTIRAIGAMGQQRNVQPLAINGLVADGVSPADQISLFNCSIIAQSDAPCFVVSASGCRMTMRGCTIVGSTFGIIVSSNQAQQGTTTLIRCTITSPTSIRASDRATITAQQCQINGTVEGNVTVTP